MSVVVLATLVFIVTPATAMRADGVPRKPPPCSHIEWREGPSAVRRLIRCAERRWPVEGGHRKAVAVAKCESDFRWWIRGGTGNAHYGVYQQRDIYWDARWAKWGKPLGLPRDPFNALSNVVVSIRQAREVGWSPWSCA